MLTYRGAAVQVPEVVQLICQFHQLGLGAAVRGVLHLLTLPLQLRQTFVVRHLLDNTGHRRPEMLSELFDGGVRVLHCVVKQGRLRGTDGSKSSAGQGTVFLCESR